MRVNGHIYPATPSKDAIDRRLVPSILKQSSSDVQQKVREGIAALELINKNQLDQALQEAKDEVLAFIDAQDNIASCKISNLIGINRDDEVDYCDEYIMVIQRNYDVVRKCLTERSSSSV